MIDVNTGHVIIVSIAAVCTLAMLKTTKKVISVAIALGLVATVTKYMGLW